MWTKLCEEEEEEDVFGNETNIPPLDSDPALIYGGGGWAKVEG